MLFRSGFIFFFFILPLVVFAGPIQPQFAPVPGATLLQKRILWLWNVLPVVTKACRAQTSCQMSESEKQILDQVITFLPKYSNETLEFKNEAGNESLFSPSESESHRIAVTGNSPDSKIILNLDRVVSLNPTSLVSILGHEIIHHAGIKDDSTRVPDQIGAKLGRYFEAHSASLNLEEYNHPEIQIYYFSVGVPETKDYFSLFRGSQNARVFIADGETMYDLAAFDQTSDSMCYKFPSDVYVNQQVSNPRFKIERWFHGDDAVIVHFNAHSQSVCWDQSDRNDVNLRGVQLVGEASVVLKLSSPSVDEWPKSKLSIVPSSLRALIRRLIPEEMPEDVNLVQLERVISAPTHVAAGETWRWKGIFQFKEQELTPACQAAIRAQSWHSVDLLGDAPPYIAETCNIQKLSDGRYQVIVEKLIPKDVYPGKFELNLIGFMTRDQNTIASSFPTPSYFEITNTPEPAPVKILGYRFTDASLSGTHVQLNFDQTYHFEVRIQNAHSIYDAFLSGQLTNDEFNENFAGNLGSHAPNAFFSNPSYKQAGDVLIATYTARFPRPTRVTTSHSLKIFTIQVITDSLGEAMYDRRSQPDVILLKD